MVEWSAQSEKGGSHREGTILWGSSQQYCHNIPGKQCSQDKQDGCSAAGVNGTTTWSMVFSECKQSHTILDTEYLGILISLFQAGIRIVVVEIEDEWGLKWPPWDGNCDQMLMDISGRLTYVYISVFALCQHVLESLLVKWLVSVLWKKSNFNAGFTEHIITGDG